MLNDFVETDLHLDEQARMLTMADWKWTRFTSSDVRFPARHQEFKVTGRSWERDKIVLQHLRSDAATPTPTGWCYAGWTTASRADSSDRRSQPLSIQKDRVSSPSL